MVPCDHKEEDTRLLIHLQDAVQNDCTNCVVRTVDTDVVAILIGKFHYLTTLCQNANIWIASHTTTSTKSMRILVQGGMEMLSRCDACLYFYGTPSLHGN